MRTAFCLLLAALVAGCGASDDPQADMDDHGSVDHAEAPHWTYSGESGPAAWASLSEDFAVCDTGTRQSPIDLTAFTDTDLSPLSLSYADGGTSAVNNGHTVQVNFESGSSLSVDGESYQLLQFHFHSPSENHVEGQSFPLEAHLVHANGDGSLAVLGVLFVAGEANEVVQAIWNTPLEAVGESVSLSAAINAGSLLPDDLTYYQFDGSLTTPPCTEGVRWMVLANPVPVSPEQVDQFVQLMGGPTNRPVQDLNDRAVLR